MTDSNHNNMPASPHWQSLLKHPHPFGGTLVLSLLLTLAIGLQLHWFLDNATQAAAQRYGQTLANLAAEQAAGALLNQDQVSLNAQMADIGRNLDVAGATLHDVEHRLLAQVGTLAQHNPHLQVTQFSAPVVLQDSVAGYVTVAVNMARALDNRMRLYGRLLLTTGLLVALFWLWARRHRPLPAAVTKPASGPKKVRRLKPRVKLTLDLLNLEQLHTELNGEAFKQLLNRFERQLQGVTALYGGESQGLQNNQLTLLFSDENRTEASFRAICSAELLHSLSESSELALKLGARILPFEASANLKAQYSRQLKPGGTRATLISVKLLDEGLTERCQFAARADQRSARVEQLLPPYQQLLSNQCNQLCQAPASEA